MDQTKQIIKIIIGFICIIIATCKVNRNISTCLQFEKEILKLKKERRATNNSDIESEIRSIELTQFDAIRFITYEICGYGFFGLILFFSGLINL